VIDADGYISLTGRLKEIINRGGEMVSPREVDEILMDHPAVAQVVCFGMPHPKLGEEVAAAVVLREGQTATERDLQAFVAIRAAEFKVPKKILVLDEIPKGATGKLQRIGLAAKLGLGYDYSGLATLARLVGPSAARDILFSARFLEADEALRIGLINFLVDEAELEARVSEYAGRIAANAPLTVRAAKSAMNVFERYADHPEAAQIKALVDRCYDSEDYKEGRRAFMEKRTPRFTGR
jgi:hypothetical protein